MTKSCNIVVACCDKLGIGLHGDLPWTLKSDKQFFRKLTSTAPKGKQNALIMGRKTYFSIPERFRPMKNRLNIVLSRDDQLSLPEGVHRVPTFKMALELTSLEEFHVEEVFVIGGSSVYQEAFNYPYLHRIYLTRLYNSMECDVFLPTMELSQFKRVQLDGVPAGLQTENDINYEFQVYQRMKDMAMNISMMAAMCTSNRGIGLGLNLPWPKLQKDYEYYITLTSSTSTPGGLVANIKGRRTFESSSVQELSRASVLTIVLSSSSDRVPNHPTHLVASSMDEALQLCKQNERIESVWIMGGQVPFQLALSIPECTQFYLTEIDGEYMSDAYMPMFEHLFVLSRKGETIIENGVKYRFNVYKRKSYS
ncbi:uncharacterized protein [Watersipora subatra]|uniref:uncharacterized protein n=1 Tax=Watersipora subatra TaxID=2589382 RepID=UPI00355C67B6